MILIKRQIKKAILCEINKGEITAKKLKEMVFSFTSGSAIMVTFQVYIEVKSNFLAKPKEKALPELDIGTFLSLDEVYYLRERKERCIKLILSS